MRIYVSVLAATLALGATACGKKEAPKPATEQVKPEEKKPTEEAKKPEEKKPEEKPTEEAKKPEEKKPDEKPVEEAKPAEKMAPADRSVAAQESIAAYAAADFATAFKYFTDDATWTEVGLPDGEIKTVPTIIEFHKKQMTGWSEFKAKPARIIESGEYQAIEMVWSAKHTGAFADGTPATNKEASLAGALLLHFNDKGLIDKAWAFQNWPSVAEQLGLAPGLPEGYVAAKVPETTEVVKGDMNPAFRGIYESFGAKMKPETIEAAIDEMIADDYTMHDEHTGKTVTGKQALKDMMKGWMAMFTTDSMTVDMAGGAGDWFWAVNTDTGTYKGGIPGVEAKDQKVTTHSISFMKFENNKFKSYASYMNSFEMMSQLGLLGGAAPKPEEAKPAEVAAEVPSFGVASCDKYIAAVKECIGAMPEQGRAAFNDALSKTLDSWKQVAAGGESAKAALEQGCKSALDASKQSMQTTCPNVKWE